MIVVEVGCGSEPGPLFEGAEKHYAVDKNGPAILEAMLTYPEMTPMVADASQLEFEDSSVDVVLARNVFGDIAIGMSNDERFRFLDTLVILRNEERLDRSFRALAAIDEQSDLRKIAIMREASRILVTGGKLIAVEQETPDIAKSFFQRARQRGDFDLLGIFDVEHNMSLEKITPPNYARVHGRRPKLQTWVATKKLGNSTDPSLPDLGGFGVGQTAIDLP